MRTHCLAVAVAVGVSACLALMAPSAASAQAPISIAPTDGQVFAWEDVEYSGVELVVQAQPGLFNGRADVSRDAGLVSYADDVILFEETPGRYEGTALSYLFDADSDAGSYYWQAYYSGGVDPVTFESERVAGPVQSF